jgi:glycosyltransferase involved in cell wall biosynthesis
MGKKEKMAKYPLVSICTPTFNRRPFIPIIIKCFENQTYPRSKMEWIIVDDGTDKIEDLVSHIPEVKYFKYEEKLSLGKKRNITNEKATGDIIIYMDDDDYYPAERVSHAVTMLRTNPKALCAGSSTMFMYFKHINKMLQFGPYGPNHSTAATFAFKKELLSQTKFDEISSVAEERKFLKDYMIPFVQLDPAKSIVVFSHNHNSFDKKELLQQMPNPYIHETSILPADIVKEPEILRFFMEDIDKLLDDYKPGLPQNKPDVTKQISEIKENREKMIQDQMQQQQEYQDLINNLTLTNPQMIQNKIDQLTFMIQELSTENNQLKNKVVYLEDKIKQLIIEQIQYKRNCIATQN